VGQERASNPTGPSSGNPTGPSSGNPTDAVAELHGSGGPAAAPVAAAQSPESAPEPGGDSIQPEHEGAPAANVTPDPGGVGATAGAAPDEPGPEAAEAAAPAPADAAAVVPTAAVMTSVAQAVAPNVAANPVAVPRAAPRAPVGPGGGKRRKPGQAGAAATPEWVAPPPPRQASFLGGPAIWGVIAIVAVLLAGTVLSNGAFTPFAVDTVAVATNVLTSDTVAVAPGRVQTTSITLGDLTPGTTVVRAPFSVRAEAPGTGKPIAAYVSLVSERAVTHVRAVVFRCLDAGGSPAPCDAAVGFSDARLDTGGTAPIMIETTGGPPTSATVRSVTGGDLEILDGAGNVKRGGKVRGIAPVARPEQGASAKLSDFFVVGGTTGGLGHGAQEVGVSGAKATLPMIKGIPGLAPGGQSYLLSYWYAVPGASTAEAQSKVGVTIAVLSISADATP